jgi:hypothetical protein
MYNKIVYYMEKMHNMIFHVVTPFLKNFHKKNYFALKWVTEKSVDVIVVVQVLEVLVVFLELMELMDRQE